MKKLQIAAGASTEKAPASGKISLLLSILVVTSCCAACKPPDKLEMLSAGKKFYDERNYVQSEKKLEQALKLCTEQEGADGANTGSAEMYLGNTKWELGKYKEALALHKAVTASQTKQHGADNELVADGELRMGIDSISLGDKKTAKQHYENALSIFKKNLPKTVAKVKQLQSKLKALASSK